LSKGQLPKAYLRLDPDADQHPDLEALVRLMCAANRQRPRGRFHPNIVRKILGRKRMEQWTTPRPGKRHPDLVEQPDGTLYLDGWDEWNEGDLTVSERVQRLRDRRSRAVTPPLPRRSSPSEALGVRRRALGDISPKEIPEKAKRAAAVKGGPPLAAAGAPWVDHDPGNELEARLVKRCEDLADMVAALYHQRAATDDERREVLEAVTATPKGKSITTLRDAPRPWVEASLRACDDFERDHEPSADEPAEEA
jgi:hypothetical protein